MSDFLSIIGPMFKFPLSPDEKKEFRDEFEKLSIKLGIKTSQTILKIGSLLKEIYVSNKKYIKFCFYENDLGELDYLVHFSNQEDNLIEIDDSFFKINSDKELEEIEISVFQDKRLLYKKGIGGNINQEFSLSNTEIITYLTRDVLFFVIIIDKYLIPQKSMDSVEFFPIIFKKQKDGKFSERNNKLSFSVHAAEETTKSKQNPKYQSYGPGFDMGSLYP